MYLTSHGGQISLEERKHVEEAMLKESNQDAQRKPA